MHVFEIKHTVAHSADDMFRLVADVESYPKFLPLCEALKLKRRETRDGKEVLIATMVVGYKLIRGASPPRSSSTPRPAASPCIISTGRSHILRTAGASAP